MLDMMLISSIKFIYKNGGVEMTTLSEKVNISLSINKKNLDQVLNKKYFQKVPVSDDDYLYSIFMFGIANCVMDSPEFKMFTAMMINEGKIEKIHSSDIY